MRMAHFHDAVHRFLWQPGILVAVVASLLLGCANDRQRTQAEGVAAGAAAGALVGNLVGGDRNSTAAGAAIGALIGGIFGTRVADSKAAYIERENTLRIAAEQARQSTLQLQVANDSLTQDIRNLEASVQRMKVESLSLTTRRNLAQQNQKTTLALVERTDLQLQLVRQEISRQQSVVVAEEKRSNGKPEPALEPGLRLVSGSIRDLQGQAQALERARLQLQQLDQRRAYQ